MPDCLRHRGLGQLSSVRHEVCAKSSAAFRQFVWLETLQARHPFTQAGISNVWPRISWSGDWHLACSKGFVRSLHMSTMKAVVFKGKERIGVEEVPKPTPRAGEAVIRITATTICGTDVHIVRGE